MSFAVYVDAIYFREIIACEDRGVRRGNCGCYSVSARARVSMRKILLIAIWIAATTAVAAIGFAVHELRRTPVAHPEPIDVDRLPPRQRHNTLARWTVTEHLSAHNVLIAQVETEYLDEALAIAQQLTEPIRAKYAEVLIYFHRPGRPDTLPPRRVQWTPQRGYIQTSYADAATHGGTKNEERRTGTKNQGRDIAR
jgi:hypothetical protein